MENVSIFPDHSVVIVHVDLVANGVMFHWICVETFSVRMEESVCTLLIILRFVNAKMDLLEKDVRKNVQLDMEVYGVISN